MAVPWRGLIDQLYNVQGLIQWGGTLLVCVIVFVETGLFVGFFLPGDSLLVTAGVFAATGQLELAWLLLPVPLCAIAGDQLGYFIGRKAGVNLYRRRFAVLQEEASGTREGVLRQARRQDNYPRAVHSRNPDVLPSRGWGRADALFAIPHVRHFRRYPLGVQHGDDRLHARQENPERREADSLGNRGSDSSLDSARHYSGVARTCWKGLIAGRRADQIHAELKNQEMCAVTDEAGSLAASRFAVS